MLFQIYFPEYFKKPLPAFKPDWQSFPIIICLYAARYIGIIWDWCLPTDSIMGTLVEAAEEAPVNKDCSHHLNCFIMRWNKRTNRARERKGDQIIATDLFDCEPLKVHDTVLHHLHPPAVFVWCCSLTIFAAACEQRMGLQHGGRIGGGGSMGHFCIRQEM